MKFKFKGLVVAAAFMAAGAAANADTLTLGVGDTVTNQGYTVSSLSGTGSLSFSSLLLDALNLGAATVSGESPAVTTINGSVGGYTSVNAAAPIQAVTGSFDGSTLSVSNVSTGGGASISLNADEDQNVTTGGFITITDLRVDLVTMDVYANITGGNGVGTVSNLKLWHVGSITGPTSFSAADVVAAGGSITVTNTLSQLTIYDDAFNLFAQATGLIDVFGLGALKAVNDDPAGYGTITSSITLTVTAVPEPSTYALMGVGLVGLAFVRRRAAK